MHKQSFQDQQENQKQEQSKPQYTVSSEIALQLCGNGHKYQSKSILWLSLFCLIISFFQLGYPLMFTQPEFECIQKGESQNQTPIKCTKEEACSNPQIKYFYPNKNNTKSLIYKFDLLCENDQFETICGISLLLGGCFGSIVYGELMERKGRVRTLQESVIIMIISCIIGFFSISIYMFYFCAFWFGFGARSFFNSAVIYICEITSENLRQLSPCFLYIGRGFGTIIICLLAYLHSGWQNILIFYTGIPLGVLLFFIQYLQESPRFLVVKKQFNRAKQSLIAIAQINKRQIPEDFLLQEEIKQLQQKEKLYKLLGSTQTQQDDVSKQFSYQALFEFKSIRSRTLVITYIWCIVRFTYFLSNFQIQSFEGNHNANIAAMGLSELIAYIFSGYLLLSYPRRSIFKGILLYGGFVNVAFLLFQYANKKIFLFKSLTMGGILLLRIAICAANCILNVYVYEIYPTVVRHFAFGYFGFCMDVVVTLVAPFVSLTESLNISPFVPLSLLFFAGIPMMDKLRETFRLVPKDNLEEEQESILQQSLVGYQ